MDSHFQTKFIRMFHWLFFKFKPHIINFGGGGGILVTYGYFGKDFLLVKEFHILTDTYKIIVSSKKS